MADNAAPQNPREEQGQPVKIEQHAGNNAIQIGQVFGNVAFQILTPKSVLLILIAIAVTAAGVLYWRYITQKPAVMTGNFNIAVAQFGEVNAAGKLVETKIASEVSLQLARFLDSEYRAADLKVQVAHDRMPIIPDGPKAQQLAADVHADLVIYGSVYVVGNEAKFSPMFYVAEKPEKSDTTELTGASELAKAIVFDISSLASQETVHEAMQSRAAILVDFTSGLISLSQYLAKESQDDLQAADVAFRKAISTAEEQPEPFKGQEVLYLFAATTARLQKDIDGSARNLDRALTLNSGYARAYIARGHIYYEQAKQAAYDESLLQQALAEYKNALAAQDQPEGAYIREKVQIGIGHVSTVLAQKTKKIEWYAQAIQAYQQAVASYENTRNPNLHLQSLASIGYDGLGLAYERQRNYAQAREVYQKCVAIAEQITVKIECLRGLGEAHNMQGDYAQGAAAYQQCIDLTGQSFWKPYCFAGLGTAYEKQKNSIKARETYQQCVTLANDVMLKDYCSTRLAETN